MLLLVFDGVLPRVFSFLSLFFAGFQFFLQSADGGGGGGGGAHDGVLLLLVSIFLPHY